MPANRTIVDYRFAASQNTGETFEKAKAASIAGLRSQRKRADKSQRLKTLIEEERVNHQAALAIREARKRQG